jgi:uncharacterized membrane protein
MSNLSSAKTYGGIGAILTLIGGFVPVVGPAVSIVGFILLFLAVKQIYEVTKDEEIYSNYKLFFILSIISVIAVAAIGVIILGSFNASMFSSVDYSAISDVSAFFAEMGTILMACISILLISWILAIIGSIFLRRSYNKIAEKTGVGLFRTTGLLYFIGALTIIILIGAFIILIAKILEIVAYFSLPDTLPSGGKDADSGRRCPNCGRSIPEDARACPYCAKRFEDYL